MSKAFSKRTKGLEVFRLPSPSQDWSVADHNHTFLLREDACDMWGGRPCPPLVDEYGVADEALCYARQVLYG
ncbi:MAG: hypothetical protein L6R28_22765 [Planctomycetes bacterium]|nr:hypothetical protein [Planctomycetota bacterium]